MAGAMVNPVLLGFPDEETKDDKLSYDISKIGGKPVSLFFETKS